MSQYVNATGWWTAFVHRNWREDVTDGPDIPKGTVLGTVSYGEWDPVAMWKIGGEDHTSTLPIIVEDGCKFVEMGSHISDHRELLYTIKYSPDGKPSRLETRDILKQ